MTNARSKRPVITMRVSEEVFAALHARATADVRVAHLAELYVNAGLAADGVDLPQVHRDARVARGIAAKVMARVGRAVNDAVAAVLEEELDENDDH